MSPEGRQVGHIRVHCSRRAWKVVVFSANISFFQRESGAMAKVVKVGIWGIGRAGYSMIRAELLPLKTFKIVAGCDLIAARARKLAKETGAKAYTDPAKFLKDPN